VYNLCLPARAFGWIRRDVAGYVSGDARSSEPEAGKRGKTRMNAKSRFAVGVLTALAMMLLTFALPRGGPMRDAAVVQFPITVGIWAIFVLLFVKLK
jgi:hypothetical protein